MQGTVPSEAERLHTLWEMKAASGRKRLSAHIKAVKDEMAKNGTLRRRLKRMVTETRRWAGITPSIIQRPREQKSHRRATRLSRRTRSTRGDPEPSESHPTAVIPTAVGKKVQGTAKPARPESSGSWLA